MGGSCRAPLESSALQRIGMISHRVGDFVLCKATLENNLIGAMQQYTGLIIGDTESSSSGEDEGQKNPPPRLCNVLLLGPLSVEQSLPGNHRWKEIGRSIFLQKTVNFVWKTCI